MTYVEFYDESKLKEDASEDTKVKNNRFRYNVAKTISMKKFIAEFGGSYTPLIKENLLKLEMRSVLTRVENMNVLNIKHVEHLKHISTEGSGNSEKEYIFGQLVSLEGNLYFSNSCSENEKTEKCQCVNAVYDSIDRPEQLLNSGNSVKVIDDGNVVSFIDGLLSCIPDVSERYLKILKEMTGYEK